MDVSAIQRLIAEDIAANRVPLMVLADAGTTIAGHSDNISRLHDLCRLHDCWLHLRGHTLAALAITHGNTTIVINYYHICINYMYVLCFR